LSNNHRQQELAVKSGHWPLFRFDPGRIRNGKNPLHLDSPPPSVAYREFVQNETRFNMLWRSNPEAAERYLARSQDEVRERYHRYQQLAELPWEAGDEDASDVTSDQPPVRED
jgi:pyruvate-ferredoxin/flavodoxin oxidoreductase